MARKMKDSGIEWIGEIPEGWEIVKIKYGVTKVGSGKTPSGGAEVYTDCGVLFLRSQNIYDCSLVLDNPTYISYETDLTMKSTRILPNDILLNITGASIGRCCVVPETLGPANVNQHVCIIRTNPEFFLPKFMQYFWVSHLGRYAISLFQTGGNREGLSFDAIRNTPIPYISIPEQSKIITYLDSECSRIDVMLSKTRSSIEEYKKLKQAVITQAVTKGVRGEREMKDSGVEWIGTYPSNWKIIKIKWLLHERKDRSVTGLEEPLSMSQKKGLIPTKDMDSIPNMASSFIGAKLVYKGDLVFNKLKAHLGVFSVSKYNGLVSPDYAVYYSTGLANLNFLELLFKTPQYINEFKKKSSGVGAGLTRLYTGDLYSIYCALPPLVEQEEIADYLDIKCAEIDKLIAKKEQLVKELESYKKSLIYEVVTGKREV